MRSQVEKLFIIGAIIAIGGIFIFYYYRSSELKKNGVYVIGKVIGIKNVENGYIATISYRFGKKKYRTYQKTLPSIQEKFVYLLIASNRPKLCSLLKKPWVPQCVLAGKFMDSSWATIPICEQ
jgi:hypothetical protein